MTIHVAERKPGRSGAMVLRGFCSQNVAIGGSFGVFSVTVLPLQEKYGASLANITLGLAFVVLAMGLLAPVAGKLIRRHGFRPVMLVGAAFSLVGFLVMAFAPDIRVVLAAYALLIGPGLAFSGSLPASTLAEAWAEENKGRALGIVNAPVFVALGPLVGYAFLAFADLRALYLFLAALNLLLVPILLGVANPPESVADESGAAEGASASAMTTGDILRRPAFWLVVATGGILGAISIIAVTHVIPIGVEKEFPLALATLLASLMGGASVIGAVAVGFICDRIGGARTLALEALVYLACWGLLMVAGSFWLVAPVMLIMGAIGAGIYPATVFLLSHLLGQRGLALGLGLNMMLALPFTFFLPPLASHVRDAAPSYQSMMLAVIAGCVLVVLLALTLVRKEHFHRPPEAVKG